jgi:Flp pilus assembly pilin Flp
VRDDSFDVKARKIDKSTDLDRVAFKLVFGSLKQIWRIFMHKMINRNRAQTLAEYALILALIVIVAIAILAILGQTIKSKFSQANSGIGQ